MNFIVTKLGKSVLIKDFMSIVRGIYKVSEGVLPQNTADKVK